MDGGEGGEAIEHGQPDGEGPAEGGTEADERHGLRDGVIVVSMLVVFAVVVLAAARALPERTKADASDLDRIEGVVEIDLGDLEGRDALLGVTRSGLLPVVVEGDGAGETSLSVVDARRGRIIDAGPLPVDGWATNVFPRASDRYVAMLVNVCIERPVEGDAGEECGPGSDLAGAVPVDLLVYDIEGGSWETLRLTEATAQVVGLADVDGTHATLEEYVSRDDEPRRWATVDLTEPLAIGAFTEAGAPRPNGLADSHGHFDGWGWKASGANGWDAVTTWTGSRSGSEATETIHNTEDRRFAGAGTCLLIESSRNQHLDHLHRLCTS